MKKFLTLAALLVSALLLAEEAPSAKDKAADTGKPAVRPAEAPDGAPRPGARMQENLIKRMRENAAALLKKYDADGDGKLAEAEQAALDKDMKLVEELFPLSVMYKRLKLIDKDGDLQISEQEAANIDMGAIRESMQRNRGGAGAGPEGPNRPGRPMPRNRGDRKPQPAPAE